MIITIANEKHIKHCEKATLKRNPAWLSSCANGSMHLLKYIKALRLTDNSCLRPERWIVLPYLTVTVFSAGLRVMVYSPGATRMLSPFSVPNQYSLFGRIKQRLVSDLRL